jgi:two-component system chemotaxis sensor kinase CheA
MRRDASDKALADIPVILVTSRADNVDRERGLRLGADAYVVKQKFDQDELLRTVGQMV